jgi:cytochrome P450
VRDPIGWFERCRARYGDCATVRFLAYGEAVWFASPADVREILTADSARMHAGEMRWLEPALGTESLVLLDEERHLRHRRLLLPAFHHDVVARYHELIADITRREVERWPLGEEFPIRNRMQRIALETLLRAVFGVEEERLDELRRPLLAFNASFNWLPWGAWIRRDLGPRSPWGQFVRRRATVDRLIYREIAERRSDPALHERRDVLALLLQAHDEDGSVLTDKELRDEMMTLLLAGHLTTATTLAWAFHFLLRDAGWQRRVQEELHDGGSEQVDAVMKETLRMRPAVPLVGRVLTEPTVLGGYRVPAGAQVAVPILLTHHLPELYPEPHEFRPERFLGEGPAAAHYLPYGRGLRRCIGANLANFEMRLVMQGVLRRAELRPASAAPEPARGIGMPTIGPARGGKVVLDRLRSEPAEATGPSHPHLAVARGGSE